MLKEISFDMDGTIADFYGVNGWLEYLKEEKTYPYEIAKPLVNFSILAKYIHKLQNIGYSVNIISWTSKNGSAEFNAQVKKAKEKWLKKHLPSVYFDQIHIIDYGTPKRLFGKGILFDDEEKNRIEWGKGAHDVHNILKDLKMIMEE